VLSMPVTGGSLLCALQTQPALPAFGPLPPADAIVVLSAESDRFGTEYGHAVAGSMTMQRLRYGVFLQRRTKLPMLVSGGIPDSHSPALATMMEQAAQHEFQVPVKWIEDRSADTWENAQFSAAMLKADGCKRILLVTSAWHMPRSVASFEAHGIEVVPAPTAFRAPPTEGWTAFAPHWTGLKDSCIAMHEWFGGIVYWFRR